MTKPTYNIKVLREKLTEVGVELDRSYDERSICDWALSCLDKAQALRTNFAKVINGVDYAPLENVRDVIEQIYEQVLHHAHWVWARIYLDIDIEPGRKRLEECSRLIQDGEALSLAALEYMEAKSPSAELELTNLTEALKDLIKMI